MATATAAPKPKLKPAQARKIERAERACSEAKAAFEAAKVTRAAVREEYAHLVPAGEEIEVGGIRIKRRVKSTGRKFRLSDYLDAGHKISAAMKRFVSAPSSYEDWSVVRVGPPEERSQ